MELIIWILYWSLITLIDQIVEHNFLTNKKIKKFLSFLFVFLTLALILLIVIFFKAIIPFLIALNIYWLLVWKIHDLEFIIYIICFFVIILFFYNFKINDLYIIIFVVLYNLFFKFKIIKNLLNKWKIWLFLYRFMGRYYIVSIIFILFFNNLSSGLFNIWSTFISFLLAKKYKLKD